MTRKTRSKATVHNRRISVSTGRRARLAQTPVKLWTAGQELFRPTIEAEGFSLRQLEEITGLSKSTVSALLLGTRSPGTEAAETLERKFGIPEEAWHRAPGWRLEGWGAELVRHMSILSIWAWRARLLMPSKLSQARLIRAGERLASSCSDTVPHTATDSTVETWGIVGPELAKLPPALLAKLELPVGGQAPADALKTICIGMIHSLVRHQHQQLAGDLLDTGAVECAQFICDLLCDVHDVAPEVAA